MKLRINAKKIGNNSTDEENNVKNDEGNQFGEKVVDFGKHCIVISPENVLRVL